MHGIARVQALTPADIDAWHALEASAVQELPPQSMAHKHRDDLLLYFDGSHGRAYGIFNRGELIAGALMRGPTPENPLPPGGFPRLSPTDWTQHTGFLENAMVASHARGRGHQRALLQTRRLDAIQLKLRWLASGVRASNSVSWLNLIRNGLSVMGHRQNVDGTDILALLGALGSERLLTDPEDYRSAHRDELEAHRRALQEGYFGTSLFLKDLVAYERAMMVREATDTLEPTV